MTVELAEDVVEALLAGLLGAGALFAWDWGRQRGRFAIGGGAAAVAWLGWHLYLQVSNAASLDVDNPLLLGLSGEDASTGVVAFLLAALPLGLVTERREPAGKVVRAAAIVAAVVTIVDLFL